MVSCTTQLGFAVIAALSLCVRSACAEDKSRYTLFNPTPRNLMRELSTDRPDKTESPYTVDAGHVQVEMDFANYVYRDDKGSQSRDWNILPFNLKIGLLNTVDVQLIFNDYLLTRNKNSPNDKTKKTEGVGNVTSRLKINVWGDDGGDSAFAIMPFITFPTSSNGLESDSYEGGLILPLALTLPAEIWLGMMTEIDIVRDDDNSGNHSEFVNSVTLGHAIVGELAGYVEFFSSISAQSSSEWIGTFDAGVTYGITPDVQIDVGLNIGVTNSADDLNPFTGLSWRF